MNNLKGVLRSTIVMFLFVGFFGLLVYADETQEQKVERLIKELQDEDSGVRVNAAWALGEIGAVDAVPALIQALQDPDSEVRVNVVWVLGQIGTPEAIKAAVTALIQAMQDQNEVVRIVAALTLEKIGTPEALEAIKNLDK